ncbi:MAG: hypothetical protein IJ574_04860 [Bacilli bacterium]|nr:hypothetical protein [Bacilli bacterium]
MIIDYITYIKGMGLDINLDIISKEKLTNFINEIMNNFDIDIKKNKVNITDNNNRYFLDVKSASIAIVPSKSNETKKMWEIKLDKNNDSSFTLIYIEDTKDIGIKYIDINFNTSQDLNIKSNIYYFNQTNEYNLNNHKSFVKLKEQRKDSLISLFKNKKSNKDNIENDLNTIVNVNKKYSAIPDLSIHIESKYIKGVSLNNKEIKVDNNTNYNVKLIKNYIDNNINDIDNYEINNVFNNYKDIIINGLNPYIMKQKRKTKNKCA